MCGWVLFRLSFSVPVLLIQILTHTPLYNLVQKFNMTRWKDTFLQLQLCTCVKASPTNFTHTPPPPRTACQIWFVLTLFNQQLNLQFTNPMAFSHFFWHWRMGCPWVPETQSTATDCEAAVAAFLAFPVEFVNVSFFQVRNENQHSVSSGNNYRPIFIRMSGTMTGWNRVGIYGVGVWKVHWGGNIASIEIYTAFYLFVFRDVTCVDPFAHPHSFACCIQPYSHSFQ